MKQNILHILLMLLNLNAAMAQFNTIGYVSRNNKTIQSKGKLTDSLNVSPNRTDSSFIVKNSLLFQNDPFPTVALPLKQIHITSPYGMRRHPVTQKYSMHHGLDLRARYESVFCMLPGEVIDVGEDAISGKYTIIQTGDFLISYCHLSVVIAKKGEKLKAGDIVAISGNSGRSTAPHLHLTCRFRGLHIDPNIIIEYKKEDAD